MNNNTTESDDLTASQEATAETPRKKASKKSTRRRRTKKKAPRKQARTNVAQAAYPRHAIDKCIRIPRAIVEQNAGKECTESEAADFVGIGKGGPLRLEISSCIKFNLLERPSPGRVIPTDLAKKIIRPQNPQEELKSFRERALSTLPVFQMFTTIIVVKTCLMKSSSRTPLWTSSAFPKKSSPSSLKYFSPPLPRQS